MSTKEKAERNAEIVRRRVAGESAASLAREFGVTLTRIRQLAIRQQERDSGAAPVAKTKRSAPATDIRPRLRQVAQRLWECADTVVAGQGETPKAAYDSWILAAIAAAQPPKVQRRAAVEPEAPYGGPVVIVPGLRPNRPLQLSQGLRLNGARAMAVQPKTPSLSGGRRGGFAE